MVNQINMRRLNRRDSIDDIYDQMQKMFNQFQDFGRELDITTSVPVNIREEDGRVVLTADMPGVQKEDISLKADEKGVEIAGESQQQIKEENEKYLRKERSSRTYRRKIVWPTDIDPDTIKAKYEDGVLTVEAEKEESDDNWDIEIE